MNAWKSATQSLEARRLRAAYEAEIWLGKLERTLRREESAALRAWLQAPLHREVILDQCRLLHGPEVLAVLSTLFPVRARVRSPTWYGRVALTTMLIAGVFGTLMLLGAGSSFSRDPDSAAHTLRYRGDYKAIAAARTVDLPDSSKLVLNAGSRVLIDYGVLSRDVTLFRGEALFDVVSDAGRPFHVHVWPRRFEIAANARFDLRRKAADEIELTVVAGQVHARESRAGTLTPAQLRARVAYGAHTFHALDAGLLGRGWQLVWQLEPQELAQRIAWQRGRVEMTFEPRALAGMRSQSRPGEAPRPRPAETL